MVRLSSALSSERYQTTCAISPTSANVLTCQHQCERTKLLAPQDCIYSLRLHNTWPLLVIMSARVRRFQSCTTSRYGVVMVSRLSPPSLEDIEETSRQARGGPGHCVPVSLPCRDSAFTFATGPAVQMMQIASLSSVQTFPRQDSAEPTTASRSQTTQPPSTSPPQPSCQAPSQADPRARMSDWASTRILPLNCSRRQRQSRLLWTELRGGPGDLDLEWRTSEALDDSSSSWKEVSIPVLFCMGKHEFSVT